MATTKAPLEQARYEESGAPDTVQRWLPWAATVVCLAGVGVAVYLTLAHYLASSVTLACPGGVHSAINCEKVTTSPQSVVFGIPVAVLGLAYFTGMTLLNLPPAWHRGPWWLAPLRLAISIVGIGFALYLVATELLVIDAICLWCTSAHVLSFALFLLVLAGTTRTGLRLGAASD